MLDSAPHTPSTSAWRDSLATLIQRHVNVSLPVAQTSVDATLSILGSVAERRRERLRARIEKELDDVAAEYCLSKFSATVFKQQAAKAIFQSGEEGARVRAWVFQRINGGAHRAVNKGSVYSPWQMKCPILVPNLEARPFWEGAVLTDKLPWVSKLEALFPLIREEFLALRTQAAAGGFQPYRAPTWTQNAPEERPSSENEQCQKNTRDDDCDIGARAHDRGSWNVFYLWLHNIDFSEHRKLCPATSDFIENSLDGRHYSHAFFSAMAARTHITRHNGPTNKKLRVHLPLIVPGDGSQCRIRVGDQVRYWQEGKVLVFDDSFEHEAWNDADAPRVVLIFDVWHPDFARGEFKIFDFLTKSQMRAEKKAVAKAQAAWSLHEEGGAGVGNNGSAQPQRVDAQDILREDNLFSIIERTRKVGVSESEIWA